MRRNSIAVMPWSRVMPISLTKPLPACCLHLFIHLAHITSVREVHATVEQKHPRMLFDFAMCCGPPIISMALRHRFDIIQDFGPRCTSLSPSSSSRSRSSSSSSSPSPSPPPCSTPLLFRRHLTFAHHVASKSTPPNGNTSAITLSRYLRLMSMALTDDRQRSRHWQEHDPLPAPSLHLLGFRILQLQPGCMVPAHLHSRGDLDVLAWWAVPLAGVLFFAFGRDAVMEYRAAGGGGGEGGMQGGDEGEGGGGGGAAWRFRAAVPEFQTASTSMTDAEDTSTTSTTYSKPEFTLVLPFVVSHDLSLRLVFLIAFRLALPSHARTQTRRK
ncbi:hypothetical protein C8R45DRAFT_1219756 [Mycena sanguinolenta]|nr:hypothetical protein C8R45DRAFT_1219756 [Mycena sanguinolenta]